MPSAKAQFIPSIFLSSIRKWQWVVIIRKIGLVKRTYKDVYSFYTTNCGMS